MTVISDLLDRIHAINQTISYTQLTAYRYFPAAAGKFPFIFPLLSTATHNALGTYQGGDSVDFRSDRQIVLVCAVASPKSDNPIATAQKNTENIIDPVITTYTNTPYLTLNGAQLDNVFDTVSIDTDSGIVANNLTGLLEVRFTLTVPLIRTI